MFQTCLQVPGHEEPEVNTQMSCSYPQVFTSSFSRFHLVLTNCCLSGTKEKAGVPLNQCYLFLWSSYSFHIRLLLFWEGKIQLLVVPICLYKQQRKFDTISCRLDSEISISTTDEIYSSFGSKRSLKVFIDFWYALDYCKHVV